MARAGLEFATCYAVFWVLILGQALYRQHFEIDCVLLITTGFILAGLLGAAVGLLFCCLAEFSKVAERARGPLLRPLFWVSGIFFIPEQIPEAARPAILANPLLHIVELVRDGFFRSYTAEFVSVSYVGFWILGVLLLGLSFERIVRRQIEVT
jgi:capsular polysaccharide transport system permease protein